MRDVIKMISDHDERRGHCYKTKNYHVFISVIFQLYSVPGFNVGIQVFDSLVQQSRRFCIDCFTDRLKTKTFIFRQPDGSNNLEEINPELH